MISLCFVGCSEKKQEISAKNEQLMETTADFMMTLLTVEDNEAFLEELSNSTEFDLEYYCMAFKSQYGIRVQAEEFLSMIESWKAAKEECGAYVTHDEYVIEAKNDGYIVTTNVEYEDRDATVQFKYDEDYALESLDVSAKYGLNEILTKAGLNTLLGMGTVFAVLIFLAFLISLMKYIPNLLELFKKAEEKDEHVHVEASKETSETVADVTVSQPSDDLELVAVITAAIAAQRGTSSDDFVVRSIRRRPSNLW